MHPSICRRLATAEALETGPAQLDRLARTRQWEVRMAVARHCRAQPGTLLLLALDRRVDVRRAVALHLLAPPEILARLARDREPLVRLSVALNQAVPPEVVQLLRHDPHPWVRRAADTPEAVLHAEWQHLSGMQFLEEIGRIRRRQAGETVTAPRAGTTLLASLATSTTTNGDVQPVRIELLEE